MVCYDADFDPFGGEHAYTNTCPQDYKFEGKERDTETGNDDFGARYYSNRYGRWLSADWSAVPVPVPYANLTNPQTLNLYAMVSDDPESFADLDGHCCWDWIEQQAKSFEVGVAKELHNQALAQPASAAIKEVSGLSDIAGNSPPPETPSNTAEGLGMVTTVAAPLALGVVGGEEAAGEDAGVVKTITIDGTKFPESAQHVADAQAAGHPEVVTIDREGASANRASALKGTSTSPGMDRDEYPPAIAKEGGKGASVRPIPSADNRGAGASMGQQARSVPNGSKVRIVPKVRDQE